MRRYIGCLVAVWLFTTAAHAERYTWVFEKLDPLADLSGSFAPTINEDGVAAGDSNAGATRLPTIWGLDGVPVQAFATTKRTFVRKINASGDVGGFFFGPRIPFRTVDGVVEELTGLDGAEAIGTEMNDAGVLIGNTLPVLGETLGTIWAVDGTATSVGTFGGVSSNAQDINEKGWITGYAQHPDGRWEAYLWNPKKQEKKGLGILPLPGYNLSWGTGVNKRKMVVGFANDAADRFGFAPDTTQSWLWTRRDGLTQLKIPGDPKYVSAADLNDAGYIVGNFHPTSILEGSNPGLWLPDGTFVDLTAFLPDGARAGSAADITNSGWIVGSFTDAAGDRFGYRLRPVPIPPEAQLEKLCDRVEALALSAKRAFILKTLLKAAKSCLDAGRERIAIAKLRLFRGVVRSWRRKHLAPDDARSLLWRARCVIETIRDPS